MADSLDGMIDRYMDRVDLPPKFVIPGGRPLSAALDVARAAIRRAERRVVALADAEEISGEVMRYLNRASDAVYAMARFTDVDDPSCSRARRLGGGPLTAIRATARRREGYTHDVEVDGHALVVDEPTEAGGTDPALPHPPGRRRAGLLHRDHRRDVRRAQGVGARRRRGRRRHGVDRLRLALVHGELRVECDLDDDQLDRLRVIAGKCPVHRMLASETPVSIEDRIERIADERRAPGGAALALLDPAEAATMDAHGRTEAAVLVPLLGPGADPAIVFTERRHDLRRHAGEISFPGGRRDAPDEDLLTTALREAHEEIGLDPGDVELVGALPPIGTFVTNYKVHPFVGVIPDASELEPNPSEVAAVLRFRVSELRQAFAMRRLVRRGVPIRTPTYLVGDHLIWGATARILGELLDRLDA